jgi:hypothetical protein
MLSEECTSKEEEDALQVKDVTSFTDPTRSTHIPRNHFSLEVY